ncbi:Rco1p [Sugiyamaella lignohabitans]|uniref:Rco1p n=1 Tax=Sugiyamaella lignohabitans TaxID=796027 RepID=A0A167C199_9ASCO|nr:Rco1p [Sugiyamaella lignohabitans]ANB11095.1 Rco1p [Sugiyamaella lignohabitans]
MNQLGEYEDEIPKVNKPKATSKDENDPLKLLDKNGRPRMCYRCNESALRGTMVSCDVCPLNWHVDCLPSPTWTIGSRWKCPNHADQATKLPRRPRKYKVVDTVLQRGFKNDGNVEVLDSSDEEEEGFVQDIPFFDNYDTRIGVASRINKGSEKTFLSNGVLYRLPSRGIKLDFIEAVHDSYDEPYPDSIRSDILVALDELATKSLDVQQAVRNLAYLQSDGDPSVKVAIGKENINVLVSAALEELPDSNPAPQGPSVYIKPDTGSPSPPRHTNGRSSARSSLAGSVTDSDRDALTSNSSVDDEVLDSERDQLRIIKRLMQIKGKDKLVKFLLEK